MPVEIAVDLADRLGRFLDVSHCKQSGTNREMSAETRFIQDHGPPTRQVIALLVAKPSGIGGNKDMLRDSELSLGCEEVFLVGIQRNRNIIRIEHTPPTTPQFVSRHI